MSQDFASDRELQRILARDLAEGAFQAGRMDVIGPAFQSDEPFGQPVKLGAILADVAKERNRFVRYLCSLGDDGNDVLHLLPEMLNLVEVDCASGRKHLVDGVIHRPDEGRDRTAIEGSEERLSNRCQHIADDIVGDMLAILDRLETFLGGAAVGRQLPQGFRRGDQHRRMGLEHAEEVAPLGQQPLEPSKHEIPLRNVRHATRRRRLAGCRLYDNLMTLARLRRAAERAPWFPCRVRSRWSVGRDGVQRYA
jgi:hypothetical protein